MAEKIKKFFAKKKADAKFKLAGPGHKLNDSSTTVVGPGKQNKSTYTPSKVEPSQAARQAAEAAMVRLQGHKKDTAFNTSFAAIQAKVKKELEAESKSQTEAEEPKIGDEFEYSKHLAVKGVYFKCPLISDEILTKEEWKLKIKEFLFKTLEEEKGMTSVLIIYSCNYVRTKITDCVNVLVRYLDNIIANPEEIKFHKIRCSNATFCDKVVPILGALEFLDAAGFQQQQLEYNGTMENFLVWSQENIQGMDTLQFLRDTLKAEERIELEIDRNLQVLSPAQAADKIELPQDFYALTVDELRKERQQKSEQVEKQMQLRTKAMREKDEIREIRKYKFCLIRVRFPDGLYLQGTFSVYERYSEVLEFVKYNLEHEGLPFVLTLPTGHRLEESDKESTLVDLRLVPATILLFQWDSSVEDDLKAVGNMAYLKPEVMLLVQSM